MGEFKNTNEYMIQISSGPWPEECWRVVAKVLEVIMKEAQAEGLNAEVVESVPGHSIIEKQLFF